METEQLQSKAGQRAAVEIGFAVEPGDIAEVKALFIEYAESLHFNLCFQDFDTEMETFPGAYSAPDGALLLARVGSSAAGGVGLRAISDDPELGRICEMKRLYVRPDFRAYGLGRKLTTILIDTARDLDYAAMRLDTIDTMVEAGALYRSLGFVEIPPYYDSPIDGVKYYQLALR